MNLGYEAISDDKMNTARQRVVPANARKMGDVSHKKAIIIDKDTTVYVSRDKTDRQCEAIRRRYYKHIHGKL